MVDALPRRERLRQELTEQILETGRRQLEEGGVAAVNWRGIAKEVGMNPASLYTYIDSIDDLYTQILGRSFRSLADAVGTAAAQSPDNDVRGRLLTCARAYRRWAVEHPHEFNLIYTNQIPGYVAPAEGPAQQAAMDVTRPFVEALVELFSDQPDVISIDSLPVDRQAQIYEMRALMHGFTMLEINGHAPYLDGTGEPMLQALATLLDTAGGR
ncbi:MAG: TetR/AcrR family transcriptional regulator [Ornithinimicrobium sp.]